MRKIFLTIVSLLSIICIHSCQKVTVENNEPVKLTLGFTLSDSGDMIVKSGNSDIFNMFYDMIVSGDFCAEQYTLKLTSMTSNASYTLNGTWAEQKHHLIKPGVYTLEGFSKAEGAYIQDKCSFKFNQTVEITPTTTHVVLKAVYDCFLLIINGGNLNSLANYSGDMQNEFSEFNGFRYAFVNNQLYKQGHKSESAYVGQYSNGADFSIKNGKYNYQKGKYYIYTNIQFLLDIPAMEEGDDYIEGVGEHEYVDFGLSVKWAAYNVGASSPEDMGGRYAWGETVTKDYYDWDNYMWCDGEEWLQNKYCIYEHYGQVDGKTKLDAEDDVAQQLWGNGWRMPTIEEAEELCNNTTWEYTFHNGVQGFLVTGNNGNSMFVPSCGQFDENGLSVEERAILWTSETDGSHTAYNITDGNVVLFNHKHDGVTVRAVRE